MTMRIWIDGCFDFAHHGHAGAMLQARMEGDELIVGVHNDEDILINKGPPVMKLNERVIAVEGCRWCTLVVPNAPYVTDYHVMDEYGCKYVVHGDDITTDKDGNDCYAEVKNMGRFIVVKRTPNISTTDLVGRMLNRGNNDHYLKEGWEKNSLKQFEMYSKGEDAKSISAWVFNNDGEVLVKGKGMNEKAIFINGSWDLFHPGHILLLKELREKYVDNEFDIIVGIESDNDGSGYVMNNLERSLCVLQSKYINGIIVNSVKGEDDLKKFYKQVLTVEGPIEADTTGRDSIIARVLENRQAFEERQARKNGKAQIEASMV